MNLDDLTLLRGWIRHMTWLELDAQLGDGDMSAKRRIKILRRELAAKARFYGKPAWEKLWLGERLNTLAWEQRALKFLDASNRLPEPLPSLDQAIGQWFPENACAALPFNVKTLGELAGFLEAVYAGDAPLPEPLKPTLKILARFFDDRARQLGYQLNKKRPSSALPVPLTQVTPLENVLIPEELNGGQGSNRSLEPSRIQARHDLDAIKSWLALKDGNTKTYQAYKKELERLLLWAILERGKAFSSLNTTDCQAYIRFLKALDTSDKRWVTLEPANKGYGKWKPFYCRAKKIKPESAGATAQLPQTVLSPKSINYAKTIVSSCMAWLVKQGYLKHNNFEDIRSIKFAQTTLQTNNRAFTLRHMQKIFAYAESRLDTNSADFWLHRRTLFILKFAFSTGLRIHELAAASFGDIECLEDEDIGEQYFLAVIGKHHKTRKTSLPATFIEELKHYLRERNLPAHFNFLPSQAPLIPSLRDKTGRKHLTPAGIHKILSAFFAQMLEAMADSPDADPLMSSKLSAASAHWLRHSYGSYLANDKQVPLTYIRDELGHASINTTSLYLNTDAKERQKVVSNAFSGT